MPLPRQLQPLVAELAADAETVWLAGSYARGDRAQHSDVDLGILRPVAQPSRFIVRAGLLVSIVSTTVEATRASFRNPGVVGAAIPGWRRAELVHDPNGVGQGLIHEARAWSWDAVEHEANQWVAREVVRLADSVMKVCNAMARNDAGTAAVSRNTIAVEAPRIAAVHLRLLYDSESRLVADVASAMGSAWAGIQDAALGLSSSFEESLAASLRLWGALAAAANDLFSDEQAAVVDLVLRATESAVP